MPGKFVISLDYELLWGVRDHCTRDSYGANILGARKAIPRMLEMFEDFGISATWATVGFLFSSSKEELLANLPPKELWPTYQDGRLSSYAYLDEVGENEKTDPFYYGASLLDIIQKTPGQEIATHTLSHYYTLEPGQTVTQFRADLGAAIAAAGRRGIAVSSIVFPRNQYTREHLDICREFGIKTYRGNQPQWIYQPAMAANQTRMRRLGRLLDSHIGIFRDKIFSGTSSEPTDISASQFLRPCAGKLSAFHPLHRLTIKREMTRAARLGDGYHLWWHPHNFGLGLEANLAGLRDILSHHGNLRKEFGFQSVTMAEAGK